MDESRIPEVVPKYYVVPGFGTVRDFTGAVADRDRYVIKPSEENLRCDAIEYLVRFPHKGMKEDVKKAIRCLEELLERMG